MSITRPDRRVITFFSFKGGVGRTMALANAAFRFADSHALHVIAVDWDLEAPGLHKFFGISNQKIAESRGVLDFFIEWREAIDRKDPDPPDASGWVIPITEKPYAPRHGSLSLLAAGRLDAQYDERLATLQWKDFYGASAGAAAVETLRAQLVAKADVVLVDSRTGLTDAGGICTIQVPDGVLLMTAPNEQSLEGVAQVARSIVKASEQDRAGRNRAQIWLSVCRVPSVEETYLAEQWFKEHKTWFDERVQEGLWSAGDHPQGLRTFEIPQRGRWGFGEALLNEVAGIEAKDPLLIAYKELVGTLLRWMIGTLEWIAVSDTLTQERREQYRQRIAAAKNRGDRSDYVDVSLALGQALVKAGQCDEAIAILKAAEPVAQDDGRWRTYGWIKHHIGLALLMQDHYNEAIDNAIAVLATATEIKDGQLETAGRLLMAIAEVGAGEADSASRIFAGVIERLRTTGNAQWATRLLQATETHHRIENLQYQPVASIQDKEHFLRKVQHLARETGSSDIETDAIQALLLLPSQDMELTDVAALQARLDELKKA